MRSLYSRILQKTFLWTNSLKHMFQDFKLNSEPEMSERAGKAGLGPSWLRGCNLCLYPKWTFRKSSQQERAPSQSLRPPGEQQKHMKSWRGRPPPCRTPQNPWLHPGLTEQCLWIKQDAHFPSSYIFSHPPPQTYINSENGRPTEKELCLKSDKIKRESNITFFFI